MSQQCFNDLTATEDPHEMNIPEEKGLPVNLLVGCFNNTVATYKYYWFLSILQSVEAGNGIIPKRELFSRMLVTAWYTVNYFHVSFGKQDLIQSAVKHVKSIENISIDEEANVILSILMNSHNKETLRTLQHFNKNVPHWFLSPWFPIIGVETDTQRAKRIYDASKQNRFLSLYSLYEDKIEINPHWKNYLEKNIRLLKDFCHWNLTLYLQSKNPHVPDIPNKILKPASRNNLIKQRRMFWDIVLKRLGSVNCIYTNTELTLDNYVVEHFIPYAFVSHDLIWNLIPADKSFNSSKRDKLPRLERYFMPFIQLQHKAIKIVREENPSNKLLEDYLTIFADLGEASIMSEDYIREKFKNTLQPLVTIALNNGFEYLA